VSLRGSFFDRDAYVLGVLLGILFFIACVVFAAMQGTAWLIDVLLCLFGAASGWFSGILISPDDEDQDRRFSIYGKSISAFISGFVVAKLDGIWETTIEPHLLTIALGPIIVGALLFGITFAIGVLLTFAGRDFGRARRTQ